MTLPKCNWNQGNRPVPYRRNNCKIYGHVTRSTAHEMVAKGKAHYDYGILVVKVEPHTSYSITDIKRCIKYIKDYESSIAKKD